MKKSNFWMFTLCTLLIIAVLGNWSIPLRIAVVANALVVLIDVIKQAYDLLKHTEEM